MLLLDKAPIGDGVTSACGAPLEIVRAMGAEASVRQVHHEITIHTPGSKTVWPLPEPFCTFDYRQFCESAFAQTGAEFRRASVLGRTGSVVHTTAGDVTARFLVDASGWRAALTGGKGGPSGEHRWMAFGVETEVAAEPGSGLQFHFVPEIQDGYGWVFPAGDKSRIGVLSYRGRTNLRSALHLFLNRFGLAPEASHGGFLASGLRAPVVDGVFVAGDAAGQCLPVTGEGIRTAILAGFRCGALLRDAREGRLSEQEARQRYAAFVGRSRRKYRALLGINAALLPASASIRGVAAMLIARTGLLRRLMHHYLGIFASSGMVPGEGVEPTRAFRPTRF